jgi:hypothetical protein
VQGAQKKLKISSQNIIVPTFLLILKSIDARQIFLGIQVHERLFADFFELTEFFQVDMVLQISCGDVAQLGERGVRNAEVEGSNPFISIPRKSRTWRFYLQVLIFFHGIFLIDQLFFLVKLV